MEINRERIKRGESLETKEGREKEREREIRDLIRRE